MASTFCGKMKLIKGIFAVLGIGALLLVIGLVAFSFALKRSIEPKVDPSLYEKIVAERKSWSPKYDFLPPRIDPDAEAVAFYHIPGFLQGGDIVCLRLRLPQNLLKSIISDLEASGRLEVSHLGEIRPFAYPRFGITKPQGNNLLEGLDHLPLGFRIFLFESDLEEIQKDWNHNFLAFTAVDTDRSEVVFFADNW